MSDALKPEVPPLSEGDVVDGKYVVGRVLGEGGMAYVMEAHHRVLQEKVALKVLREHVAQEPDSVKRFLREARAAAKIRSEHVARVTDVGSLPSGVPYLVMEHLQGEDLDAYSTRVGRMHADEAIGYVLQACEAIAEAHSIGLVHRDLKPGNLFRATRADGSPCVKVLDFGISKFTGSNATVGNNTHGMLGSPIYMSPEQIRSAKDVDARTDIWAIGVILFELLAASPPFVAKNLAQLVMKITYEPPAPMKTFRADIDPGLEAVLGKCLAKNPEQRFQDVAGLAFALVPYAPAAAASASRIERTLTRKA